MIMFLWYLCTSCAVHSAQYTMLLIIFVLLWDLVVNSEHYFLFELSWFPFPYFYYTLARSENPCCPSLEFLDASENWDSMSFLSASMTANTHVDDKASYLLGWHN